MKANPALWQPPDWHADFADVVSEFLSLRALAIKLYRVSGLDTSLVGFEDGYMALQINKFNRPFVEVYSLVEGRKARFGVFALDGVSEDEMYFDTVADVVAMLESE